MTMSNVLFRAVRTQLRDGFRTTAQRPLVQQFRGFSDSPTTPNHQDGFWAPPTKEDQQEHDAKKVFEAGVRHHHTANTAYPIAHGTTLRPYRVPRLKDQEEIREVLSSAYGSLSEMMLYVHVPFCAQRCQFCEYTVVDPKQGTRDDVQDRYFDALMKEFDLYRDLLGTDQKKLVGFDIGGGTPSMASTHNIERVMTKMQDCYQFDPDETTISIETTPKIAASEPEKIQAYFDMGIRRISMGVQTTDFALAKRLGRHDGDYLFDSVRNIRDAGFSSFNIDLMYGFPLREGKEDKWANTVKNTINILEPDHITLYRMRYKGTKMAHLQERVGLQQVNEQGDAAYQILTEAGYDGWTAKNTFSRLAGDSGCSDYLEKRVVKGVPYIGLGLGAQSFSHNTLAYNLGGVTKRMQQYFQSLELGRLPIQDLYHLSRTGAWGKFCSVSFYFGGIDLPSFKTNFGLPLDEAFPDKVDFVLQEGLMELQEGGRRLQMTKKGKAQYGGVLALFYAPHIQKHLIDLPGGEAMTLNGTNVQVEEGKGRQARPYEGNPQPRYERKRRPKRDPRQALSGDWAEPTSSTLPPSGAGVAGGSRAFSSSAVSGRPLLASADQPSPDPSSTRYQFGNILFGGPCNQKCIFCIGRQLPSNLSPRNHKTWPLANIDNFVSEMNASNTQRVILTGTTTDPQLYKHEDRLITFLKEEIPNVHLSIHTNGLLALQKLDVFHRYDTATISLNSFNPETFQKIHGVSTMPNLKEIVNATTTRGNGPSIKLSCVLTPDNTSQIEHYLFCAKEAGIQRIAFRHVHDIDDKNKATGKKRPIKPKLFEEMNPVRFHCNNPVFDIDGVEVTYWEFDGTSGDSLNLFADGTLSKSYLLEDAAANRTAPCH